MEKRRFDWNYILVLWAAAVILVPLWRYAPWAIAILAALAGGVGIALMRERHRRHVQGFWVEYVSPNMLRANEGDFAVAYHEGEESLYFYGSEQPRPERDRLVIPSVAAWDTAVPSWARGRRALITQRLLADRIVQRCSIVEKENSRDSPSRQA